MGCIRHVAFWMIVSNTILSTNLYASISDLKAINLRTEYKINPVIDSPKPRFSWELTSSARSQYQTAFQIMVATSAELLIANKADIWNSGKTAAGANLRLAC